MAWWFGRKAAEPVRAFVPAWLQGETETGGFVRGYEAQLDEVYRCNPVGLRAVRLVAGLIGGLPLFAEGVEKAVELVRAGGLLERAAANLLLHGNAYVLLAVDGHDRPAELHCMRPERVSVACGAHGWPNAYLYRASGQVTRIAKVDPLGRRQVAHLKGLCRGPAGDQPGHLPGWRGAKRAVDRGARSMNGELTSLAFCWRLERRDGAGLALTSHDSPVIVDGVSFEPAPGMSPAAIRSELGLEPQSSEVTGFLSDEAISEADIVAGRWDGAALRLFAADWAEPVETHPLLEGELGDVSATDSAFEVELKGTAARLERPICPLTSPTCRAELGDPQCRVDMAGRKLRTTVTEAASHIITVDHLVDDRFRFGEIRVLAGAANGERRTILAIVGQKLHLRSAPAGEIAVGTAVELVEGCDKLLATCSARFANAANFRGEPHLPGNDLLTRYPGA